RKASAPSLAVALQKVATGWNITAPVPRVCLDDFREEPSSSFLPRSGSSTKREYQKYWAEGKTAALCHRTSQSAPTSLARWGEG
ncbi:unnamed protein product, partial [Ectocarpus sp. 13 AM-2016]